MNYCRKLRDASVIIERNLHLLLIPHFDPFLRRLRIRFDRARGGKRKIPIRPHRSRAFISRTTSGSLAPALKRGANEEAIWLAASCLARLSDINLRNWKRRGSQLAENSSMDVTIPQTRLEERKGGGSDWGESSKRIYSPPRSNRGTPSCSGFYIFHFFETDSKNVSRFVEYIFESVDQMKEVSRK